MNQKKCLRNKAAMASTCATSPTAAGVFSALVAIAKMIAAVARLSRIAQSPL
jgi:hypothetical protein